MDKEELVVEVVFGMVAASLEISVMSPEGLSSRGPPVPSVWVSSSVATAGFKQDWSCQEVCKFTDSHLESSSHSTASSAWMTNHQLILPVSAVRVFLLIFKPAKLQQRVITFSTDLDVVWLIVPQTLRAPSTLTLGTLTTLLTEFDSPAIPSVEVGGAAPVLAVAGCLAGGLCPFWPFCPLCLACCFEAVCFEATEA